MLLVVMQLQGTALEQTAMLPKSGELIFLTCSWFHSSARVPSLD